jgi:hypothetical protein
MLYGKAIKLEFFRWRSVDGIGVFIRIEDRFLIWVDAAANLNTTSLDAISIQRVV